MPHNGACMAALPDDFKAYGGFPRKCGSAVTLPHPERNKEDNSIEDKSIRGVGWYIDPIYQGNGYGTEAAKATLDYMFNEVEINKIITGAAISNIPSWKIMEKIGFKREKETELVYYTYKDEPVEDYKYTITKEEYFNFIKNTK